MTITTKQNKEFKPFRDVETQMLYQQYEAVTEFFKRDGSAEIVDSLNTLVEAFLFTENMENVTPEMRIHIANQLRVVTLITKLSETIVKRKS
ncbi:hypothetical protein [Dyadobacter fermentans]|uniref:Uncharacterized protein n=1 Tax=Dyadobacter fermentans (strain ATCC 700827 / DSM 18053 / CIP 107007 / KCTC 52180 / NS114) TaxID=471854 RepID=C6VRY6_DYAFD|nr:hypothetical protein [Dyadobacter fermentans]ACT94507.1 hypothetical protein Dfer_3295 [Dyadobacter fermentans DSM 18053]